MAEAELNEVIEGMIAGESIGVVVDEGRQTTQRRVWTDSPSGLAILTTDDSPSTNEVFFRKTGTSK